jgi:aldehyde dehydrogenase (NAD+)
MGISKNIKMKSITKIYINGEYVTPHGTEMLDMISPTTNKKVGEVRLGDEVDTNNAVLAAREAFKTFRNSTKEERIGYLEKVRDGVIRHRQELIDVMVDEYGGVTTFSTMTIDNAVKDFNAMIDTLKNTDLNRKLNHTHIRLEPVGVVGVIVPWNMSNGFVCTKLSTAIAAGCTAVVKPSEMSVQQTEAIIKCFHEAGLPKGVVNFVNGYGNVVGAELTRNPGINKIAFTGSTGVGKTIAKGAVDTMKRVTLELGGKSPNIILDDAKLEEAIPTAIAIAFLNSGQACAAGTRLIVPESKLKEVNEIAKKFAATVKVGDPKDPKTYVGPMVSAKQYSRVQEYIKAGIEQGATLLVGGEGKPQGLEAGNYVKPTIFTNVKNNMRIAQEEIFGPVLSIIPYKDEEDAIAIANDTTYGLCGYVSSADKERAYRVAARIDAGRICINGMTHDSKVPFGGFKQSGIGREYGEFGLEAYLEPKALMEA